MHLPNLLKDLKRDEGWSATPYKDSEGILTIGYGYNLENPMPEPLGHMILLYKVTEVIEGLDKNIYWWRTLSDNRQNVLINMVYNLGISRFLGFKKTLAALKDHKYDIAAEEMLNSKWAKQVGKRATRLAEAMRGG